MYLEGLGVKKGSISLKMGLSLLAAGIVFFGVFAGLIYSDVLQGSLLFVAAAVFAVLTGVAGFVLAAVFAGRPAKKIEAQVEDLLAGRLGARSGVDSGDEIGRVGVLLDEMADDIQFEVYDRVRAMIAGVRPDLPRKETQSIFLHTVYALDDVLVHAREDIARTADGMAAGNLDGRCDLTFYASRWKELAAHLNKMLEAVASPVQELNAVFSKIALNDFTAKMEGKYEGVFDEMAASVNLVRMRLLGIQTIIEKISRGDVHQLSQGSNIRARSEHDRLMPAISKMLSSINGLVGEVTRLTDESTQGNVLKMRGDASRFEGGYAEVVEGINNTLDAISAPMLQIMQVMSAMKVNDYTLKISDDFKGDFHLLADSVREVQEENIYIQQVVEDLAAGQLSSLDEMKQRAIERAGQTENDRMTPALINMMENLPKLVGGVDELTAAAAEGRLDVRGDVSQYSGRFGEIIGSLNRFLDEVERPTRAVTEAIRAIADCQFGHRVEGAFQGVFKEQVDAVNSTAKELGMLVQKVSATLDSLAQGDFGVNHVEDYRGEFAGISTSLNTILDTFNELFRGIRDTTEQVAAGAEEVSQGSQSLSQGAAEQASAVEELTATIAEIAAQTRKNAENANSANNLATQVKQSAGDGGRQMNGMLDSMKQISESSQHISKIIKVIDDIAFQTNILALNAAVEAARAGQYGKGFAVVAEEVRTLAARSANAAKDTTEMIETTLQKVSVGTKAANDTAQEFSVITEGVEKMAELVGEIAQSSNEQASGISQVDTGVEQVSQVVQTNSATAEQSAAASEELSGQADQLRGQIERFRLR